MFGHSESTPRSDNHSAQLGVAGKVDFTSEMISTIRDQLQGLPRGVLLGYAKPVYGISKYLETKAKISPGDLILEITGKLLNNANGRAKKSNAPTEWHASHLFRLGKKFGGCYIDGTDIMAWKPRGVKVDYRNPNCTIGSLKIGGNQVFFLYAIRDIEIGVLISYSPNSELAGPLETTLMAVDDGSSHEPCPSPKRPERDTPLDERLKSEYAAKLEQGDDVESLEVIRRPDGRSLGIAAKRQFSANEFVAEYRGDISSEKNVQNQSGTGSVKTVVDNFDNNQCWFDANTGCMGELVNYSNIHHNCNLIRATIEEKPRLIIIATRDIKPGEEIICHFSSNNLV